MASKYELKQTPSGKFMFNLKAANGQTILTSELYNDKTGAKNGIKSVMKNGGNALNFVKKSSKNGQPYFVLCAQNKEVIGKSEMYNGASGRNNGIASVMRNAAKSRTVELK
jgi:uncharacterized protein